MSTDAIAAATTRLTLSRMRLHKAMQAHTDHAPTTWFGGQHALPEWVDRLKDSPEAQLLWDKAKTVLEKRPWGLIAGTVLAGTVLVWSRPWRWVLQPAVMAVLLPYLLTHLNPRAPPQPPP